jgi:hypothetical protein
MSDSPNRAVDFGAGVIVGILLAVGIGGAYTYTHLRQERMRAREAELTARLEAVRAIASALEAPLERTGTDQNLREQLEQLRDHYEKVLIDGRAEDEKPAEPPEMPRAKDPE